MIIPTRFIFDWQHVNSSQAVSTLAAGSSPWAFTWLYSHGTHQPDCTRSSIRHGLWTQSLIGPSVEVPVPSRRWIRSSHAVAPANISVVSDASLQPVMSW